MKNNNVQNHHVGAYILIGAHPAEELRITGDSLKTTAILCRT